LYSACTFWMVISYEQLLCPASRWHAITNSLTLLNADVIPLCVRNPVAKRWLAFPSPQKLAQSSAGSVSHLTSCTLTRSDSAASLATDTDCTLPMRNWFEIACPFSVAWALRTLPSPWPCIIFRIFLYFRVYGLSSNPQSLGPPFFSCQLLIVPYIRSNPT
jgi:hypothetical protein